MRRVVMITLLLFLALAGWSSTSADDGFYVVAGMKGNYAPVPKTGQTTPYVAGDDGSLQKGVASPIPRFIDNNNGTVTDNLTGLIWLKIAYTVPSEWDDAVSAAANAHDPQYGLTDGSKAGDWRLPNIRELQSLIDYGRNSPALPEPNPFEMLQYYSQYWSSTTDKADTGRAWCVTFTYGLASIPLKTEFNYSWFVRDRK